MEFLGGSSILVEETWKFVNHLIVVHKLFMCIEVKFADLKTQHLIVGGPYFVYLSDFLEMVDYVSSDFLDF